MEGSGGQNAPHERSFKKSMFKTIPVDVVAKLWNKDHRIYLQRTGLEDFVKMVPWDSHQANGRVQALEAVQEFVRNFNKVGS